MKSRSEACAAARFFFSVSQQRTSVFSLFFLFDEQSATIPPPLAQEGERTQPSWSMGNAEFSQLLTLAAATGAARALAQQVAIGPTQPAAPTRDGTLAQRAETDVGQNTGRQVERDRAPQQNRVGARRAGGIRTPLDVGQLEKARRRYLSNGAGERHKEGLLRRTTPLPGDWATPIVAPPKSDGAVRVCGDFKVTVNPVLDIDDYPLPKIEEIFANLNGGTTFSVLDLIKEWVFTNGTGRRI